MNNRQPSRFTRLIATGAARLGVDPQQAVVVYETLLCELYGGETVRFCAAMTPPSTKLARQRRIVSALLAGDPVCAIAQRERVSAQWVRRLRRNTATP
jgi:hypothetical protein